MKNVTGAIVAEENPAKDQLFTNGRLIAIIDDKKANDHVVEELLRSVRKKLNEVDDNVTWMKDLCAYQVVTRGDARGKVRVTLSALLIEANKKGIKLAWTCA